MTITTSAPAPAAAGDLGTPDKKGGKKKLLIMLVMLLAIGGAAYWFVVRPGSHHAPKPGEVVRLEPIQVNLSGGHYLKVGVALQMTADAKEADGSMALDATIDLFSGRSMAELTRADERAKLKKDLERELDHRYEGEVMGVYFTDFVTQ